jgi:DNA-directed RNA polymerase specialized sigma24 family protein
VAANLAHPARRVPEIERLYDRYAPGVYRYALAVLADPDDAERVTTETFERASGALDRGVRPRAADAWLRRIAHALCRKHGGDGESVVDELARPEPAADDSCASLAPLIFRELDGLLARRDRALLHEHLRHCDACRSLALRQRALQAGVRALAAVPLPPSLAAGLAHD